MIDHHDARLPSSENLPEEIRQRITILVEGLVQNSQGAIDPETALGYEMVIEQAVNLPPTPPEAEAGINDNSLATLSAPTVELLAMALRDVMRFGDKLGDDKPQSRFDAAVVALGLCAASVSSKRHPGSLSPRIVRRVLGVSPDDPREASIEFARRISSESVGPDVILEVASKLALNSGLPIPRWFSDPEDEA